MAESFHVIESRGNRLAAILHEPEGTTSCSTALVIVVGGPQYRVGSHRQFVHLARHLAANGLIVLRFDYTGMGDSDGGQPNFLNVGPDLSAVLSWLQTRRAEITGIALWGLCDGATAAVLHGSELQGVNGLCLVNPWVHSEQSAARTRLTAYYLERLRSRDFWRRLLVGNASPASFLSDTGKAIDSYIRTTRKPDQESNRLNQENFVEAMRAKLESFSGRILIVLSTNDLTASEFRLAALDNKRWHKAVSRAQIIEIEADHTFSSKQSKQKIADVTYDWLRKSSYSVA